MRCVQNARYAIIRTRELALAESAFAFALECNYNFMLQSD